MQDEIKIGEVIVPIIREDDVTYYPISFVIKNVLLKSTVSASLQKEYSNYIKKLKIDYGLYSGGIQNVNCISEEGLKEYLNNSKIGRLSVEQKKAMNILLEYLNLDVISEDDRFIKRIPDNVLNGYDEYVRDCISYVLEQNPNIVWQKCTKCGNYYPYHINFFRDNRHGSKGEENPLYTVCRNCTWSETRSKDLFIHPNRELRNVFNKYGEEIYKIYRYHKTIEIYNHWIKNKTEFMPKVINNEEDKLKIIKYCYDQGMFSECQDITANVIHNVCKFRVDGKNFIKMIQKELLGFTLKNGCEYVDSIEDAKRIFLDYLNKNNIIINDVYTYKGYYNLINQSHLFGFMTRKYNNNLLSLIMELYDNKYPAYKFKINGFKYWNEQDNRDRALKYFIEEDMKVSLEKVPLYITLTALRNNGANTMYNVCKKYYKNLYEWINEIYPNVFDPRDFDIHYIRNDFDSIDEAEIHDILKESFKNVIYNPRNTDRTIVIDGMIPDWFIFTDIRCYIIEYFGLAVKRDTDNKRISEYQERTKYKIEKYNNIKDYGHVYIYPDDLKDNFNGLREKLKMVM